MAKTRERVSDAADNVRPYVERAIKDEELRRNVRDAFDAARDVYNELLGNRGMMPLAVRAATDEEIQDNLKRAVDDLRKAANRIQGKEDHGTRNATLLLAGIALGILFNPITGPETRRWLKDMIGGSNDDFSSEYPSGPNGGAGSAS